MRIPLQEDARIIVRCPNWVGDVIMATPIFKCLRMNFPQAKIAALTRPYTIKILEGHPALDELIPCNDKSFKGLRETASAIRGFNPDAAILLPNSMRSYMPFRMAGTKNVFGYKRGLRKLFVDGPVPQKDKNGVIPCPMIDYYLEICNWMGLKLPSPVRPTLSTTSELAQQAAELLEKYNIPSNDQVIGLNPGAKFGSSKCWPPEYFAKLAELLEIKFGCRLLLFVGPGEDEIAEQIMSQTKSKLINTGPDRIDLALLKPMINRCDLIITNDTGPRHYATAFERPVICIMGPTDPRYTQSNLEHTIVIRKEMDCSPCHKKCCPSGDHKCMRDITPEEVLAAAQELLKKGN